MTLSLSEAQAGAEIFAAEEVGLTIWHNEDEDERYTLSQTGNDFGVDAGTGRVTASSDVSAGTYNFTLQLTDGEATAERALRLEGVAAGVGDCVVGGVVVGSGDGVVGCGVGICGIDGDTARRNECGIRVVVCERLDGDGRRRGGGCVVDGERD